MWSLYLGTRNLFFRFLFAMTLLVLLTQQLPKADLGTIIGTEKLGGTHTFGWGREEWNVYHRLCTKEVFLPLSVKREF